MLLKFDDQIKIGNQTVFRDAESPHKFYLAGEPAYRKNQYGHPQLALLMYRWPTSWEGTKGGGLFVFVVVLQLPDQDLAVIRAELQRMFADEIGKDAPEPEITLIPYSGGEVTITPSGLDDAETNASIRCKVDPRNNFAASAAIPLSATATIKLKNALQKDAVFHVKYELKADGWIDGQIIDRQVSLEATLAPLATMKDVTGHSLDLDPFVEVLTIGQNRFLSPLEVNVMLNGDFENLNLDHVTFYVEPEDGPSISHDFTVEDSLHRFVAHRSSDSWRYRYWYELHYTNSDKIFESAPITTTARHLYIPLADAASVGESQD
jgi:hypothetical protein